ncbi:MAG: tetratricopeptide repeat protein [Defluviitaleaceae bacterium]|nr:tetratricopeptide repeat protein [Defluviitaleaceae bacterium]
MDMLLYKKASDMSRAYYNRGLRFANEGELTPAIQCLVSSLRIDKKNTQARNLLGLCYHAIGRVGDALREWVISTNYSEDDNPAKRYLDSFQEDMHGLERYSQGLRNYNEALQFISQNSEDLATIRLKRATELIPNFTDALNLLALFYMKNGDKIKAAALVERVLAIDKSNPAARQYYKEVFQKRVPVLRKPGPDSTTSSGPNTQKPPARTITRRGGQSSPFAVQNRRVFAKASPISGVVSFVVGLGAMALFMYVLVFPSFLEENRTEIDELNARMYAQQVAHNAVLEERDQTIAGLRQDIETTQGQLDTQQEHNAHIQNEARVNTAHAYMQQDMHAQALAILDDVDAGRLSSDVMGIYTHVRQISMPVMEQHYFNEGRTLFNANEFGEARAMLERAVHNTTEASTVADHIYYLLGRIAEEDGEIELAIAYYEMIIEEFTGQRVTWARRRLNNLQ